MGAVDGKLVGDCSGGGQLLEQPAPDPARGLAVKAVVNRGGRTIGLRYIPPAVTGPEHMQDVGDHTAIVDAGLAWSATKQMRLDHGLGLVRSEQMTRHDTLTSVSEDILLKYINKIYGFSIRPRRRSSCTLGISTFPQGIAVAARGFAQREIP